jgi:hypothetical protein
MLSGVSLLGRANSQWLVIPSPRWSYIRARGARHIHQVGQVSRLMPLGFVETGRADADTGGSVSIGSACPDAVFGSNVPLGIKSDPGSGGTRTGGCYPG